MEKEGHKSIVLYDKKISLFSEHIIANIML